MKILASVKLSEHKYKTPEGYLVCQDAILSRTGKQTYMKSELYPDCADDHSEIEIDRKAEQVFDPKTLASFEDKPITLDHPSENVGPDNYNELSVGHVRNIRRATVDGKDVMIGDLVFTSQEAIDAVENGDMLDLSCGYDCDITEGDDPEQINIRGNHIALCEEGRAGVARIIDSVSKDSAMKKSDAIDRCTSLGEKFLEHFHKCYNSDDEELIGHWLGEMNGWLKSVKKIILKESNKPIYLVDLLDWFFTCGSSPEVIIPDMSENEQFAYDNFAVDVANGTPIEEAYKKVASTKVKDVKPRKGERKKEFLSRFMSETAKEYPDEKQRFAVANSYWERAHDSVNRLPKEDKKRLSNYFDMISTFTGRDMTISEILRPLYGKGYHFTRESIDGWNKMGDGMYRKDYLFSFDDYDDQFKICLYADPNKDWKVTEVLAYFLDEPKAKVEDSRAKVSDSVSRGTFIQEFGKQGDQYKIQKIEGNVIFAEEVITGKLVLFKKDKENVDWAVIKKSEINDSVPVKEESKLSPEVTAIKEALTKENIPFKEIKEEDNAIKISLDEDFDKKKVVKLLKEKYDFEIDDSNIFVYDVFLQDATYSRKFYVKRLNQLEEKLKSLKKEKSLDENNREYDNMREKAIDLVESQIDKYEKILEEFDE